MMPTVTGLLFLACLLASGFATAEAPFRATPFVPTESITLEPLAEDVVLPLVDESGRLRVAQVRALAKAARLESWTPMEGGFITRLSVTSPGALGLRVRLELGALPGVLELRAQGSGGRIETMILDSLLGDEAWSPWTEGETQVIEVFSRGVPARDAVRVGAALHFNESPFAKAAAGTCTLSTACSTNDATLDAAIAERKKSVMRINFVDGGSGYVCTATLIDTPRRPASFALTANHCINNNASAASITTFWFYEASACGSILASAAAVQVAGGAQLTFTNYNIDSTLLLLAQPPPAGAVYSPLNAGLLAKGQSIVSVSHPRGDTSRWALGTSNDVRRDNNRPYDMYYVNFNRGLVEPGSSGSGLFTMNAGRLELRGVLSQASTELSCTSPTLFTLYARLEALYPQIAQYIGAATVAADDAPNRPQDLFNAPVDLAGADMPLNLRASSLALDNRRIDYAGDVDVYRFSITSPAYVSAWTQGALDTVGTLLDSNGVALEANDDAEWSDAGNHNFGVTRKLQAGTYYLHVANWSPSGTGAYDVRLRADTVDTNYTDLWANPAEPGWGLNVNHQGNSLFATLYTYDADGTPMWLFMSAGDKQPDGSYSGTLYRTTGTPFSAAGWSQPAVTSVGTMRIAFGTAGSGTLQYTYNGATVAKSIARYAYNTAPTCTWSAFDRSDLGTSTNFQDLWWTPNEPGWGLSIVQQGTVLFAALYVYGTDGRPTWFVMSEGNKNIAGNWVGSLFKTSGPAFNASVVTPVTTALVGNMTIKFTSGNAASVTYTVNGVQVTKQMQRNVFGALKTKCSS